MNKGNFVMSMLILKWWEKGVVKFLNYRETELTMNELEMGLEWAKQLDKAGCKPVLFSKTWNGKFEVLYGNQFTKKMLNVSNKKRKIHSSTPTKTVAA